jgi:hypothetical protein
MPNPRRIFLGVAAALAAVVFALFLLVGYVMFTYSDGDPPQVWRSPDGRAKVTLTDGVRFFSNHRFTIELDEEGRHFSWRHYSDETPFLQEVFWDRSLNAVAIFTYGGVRIAIDRRSQSQIPFESLEAAFVKSLRERYLIPETLDPYSALSWGVGHREFMHRLKPDYNTAATALLGTPEEIQGLWRSVPPTPPRN